MSTWFPNFFNWLFDRIILAMSAKAYPNIPKSWNLSPAPSVSTTAPMIADEIFPLLKSGFAEPVASVKRITGPKRVELTDGRVLSDIDGIVYCTGYDIGVPFMTNEFNPYPAAGEVPNLYRGIFSLHSDPSVRNSLAFLGHGAVTFTGFIQHELIGIAISQIWLGNSHLPSFEDMKEWHRNYLAWREELVRKQKFESTFYILFQPFADHLQWLDKTAGTDVFEHFGWVSSKAWAFWWRERALYKKCRSGLFSPAIWRLFDTGKRKAWLRAREQIWQDNKDVERQIRERNEKMKRAESNKTK
jgi:dimethylaniline monooxygenase (N-oxide forming)